MAAFILSISAAVVIGALIWLIAGPRLKLNEEPVQNEVLNVLVYMGVSFLVMFPVVIYFLTNIFD